MGENIKRLKTNSKAPCWPLNGNYTPFNEIIFPKALTQLDGRPKILFFYCAHKLDNDLVLTCVVLFTLYH